MEKYSQNIKYNYTFTDKNNKSINYSPKKLGQIDYKTPAFQAALKRNFKLKHGVNPSYPFKVTVNSKTQDQPKTLNDILVDYVVKVYRTIDSNLSSRVIFTDAGQLKGYLTLDEKSKVSEVIDAINNSNQTADKKTKLIDLLNAKIAKAKTYSTGQVAPPPPPPTEPSTTRPAQSLDFLQLQQQLIEIKKLSDKEFVEKFSLLISRLRGNVELSYKKQEINPDQYNYFDRQINLLIDKKSDLSSL